MTDMILNPQQAEFLSYYIDPRSPTFSNALQSALRAKYSQEYAETITSQMPDWLSESLGDSKLVTKALKNLDNLLDEDNKNIQADMTKFVLKTLKKDKFSERTELTGKDGQTLEISLVKYEADTTTQV